MFPRIRGRVPFQELFSPGRIGLAGLGYLSDGTKHESCRAWRVRKGHFFIEADGTTFWQEVAFCFRHGCGRGASLMGRLASVFACDDL